jgi:HlyD family secretion protein
MKLPDRKYFYYGGGALLLLILIYFGVFRSDAVVVEAGEVSRGELTSTIDAEGRTRYHERYTITAPTTGKMYRIQLHEGDRVPKGYVLTHRSVTA